MPRVRWSAAQGVRIDRRDLQRFGLLPDGLPREQFERCEWFEQFERLRIVVWRDIVEFGIIEDGDEGLPRIDGFVTGGSRRH